MIQCETAEYSSLSNPYPSIHPLSVNSADFNRCGSTDEFSIVNDQIFWKRIVAYAI